MFKRQLLVVFLFAISMHSFSQDKPEAKLEETGLWNGVYLNFRLSDKLSYYAEHHYRLRNSQQNLYDFIGRNRQIYNRSGLKYAFNESFEVIVGPTLVLNFSPDKSNSNFDRIAYEPRIWHQWLFIMPGINRIKLYHQFRFEHRWKRDNLEGSDYKYTNRYRYKIFAYIPLNTKKIEKGAWYFSPSAEIFMHSGKSIVFNPFEDFRTYNGFGYVFNNNVTFFGGHMWTIGQNPNGFTYKKTHIIRLNLMIGLDFRKAENKVPKINLGF